MKIWTLSFNWTKHDYYYLCLIVMYSIYAYFGGVVEGNPVEGSFIKFPGYSSNVIYPTSIVIMGMSLYILPKRNWSARDLGFEIRGGLAIFLFLILLIAVSVDYSRSPFSLPKTGLLIPIIFYYTASEIVLRGIFMSWIEKILGKSRLSIIIGIIIISIVPTLVLISYGGDIFGMSITSLSMSGLFYTTRSIYLNVTTFTLISLADDVEKMEYVPVVAVMTLVLYLILAFAARLVKRKKGLDHELVDRAKATN